jgi:spoIIIJ-associated protein
MRVVEIIGKNADEAIEQALKQLNTTRDRVEIEVFEDTAKGLFSLFKSKEVKVKVTLNDDPESRAVDFLTKVFEKMNLEAEITAALDDKTLNVSIEGKDMALLIGRRGQTLDSLQYLVSLVVNKDSEDYIRVMLDTENYRVKREETLVKLAHKLAHKAKQYRKDIMLEPMNPYERRIIHSALQSNSHVSTRSEGDEPFRKVVISVNKGASQHSGSSSRPRRAPRQA